MDGGRRLAQSLTWIARVRARPPTRPQRVATSDEHFEAGPPRPFVQRFVRRFWFFLLRNQPPRGAGISAAILIVGGSIVYGTIKGDHVPTVIAALKDTRDLAANAVGFRISALAISGNIHISREEVLAVAGITGRTSLLFLDVEATRERLKTDPWIGDATVLKLLPGELQIRISEREAFALWQKDGRVSVIADDGTVLEPYITPGLVKLPLVVGLGAEKRAKTFLALLDRYPEIREQVRASILVGDRRWNLRLRNGLDIRLPEAEVAQALDRLVTLDREVKLISRDIAAIDLRLPDRVTVRLSPAAAQVRLEALKDKKPKKGGQT
jgi:cell division protein FtsQ